MEATMETEEVMEEKNPNALVLIDEGKQFAVKTDCMDPEALFLDKKNFVPMLNQVKKIARGLIADVHTEEGFKARKAMNAKLAKLKTAIEGYALCPTGQIGGWDASAEHTLEVHDQVECHLVDIVGIGDYHVLAPGARLSVVVLFHLLILFFSGTKLQLFSEQRQQTAFLRKKRFPFV